MHLINTSLSIVDIQFKFREDICDLSSKNKQTITLSRKGFIYHIKGQ